MTGAKRRIHAGHARLIDINWNRERDMKAAAWNKDALLVRFFGDDMTPARLTRVSQPGAQLDKLGGALVNLGYTPIGATAS